MLAAASQRTSTIRLGTLISILPLHHPMRVIEEACALDQLTGGRLDLGVGRGISPIETSFHGVPGDQAQERFDEAFEILSMGLTLDTIDFHGKYYQIDSAPVVTSPLQQPLPLWYGARALDRARWCARLGMPMMALVPSTAVRPLTDAYKAEWAALGRPEPDLLPLGITRSVVVADTNEEAMRIANRAFTGVQGELREPLAALRHAAPGRLPRGHLRGDPRDGHFYAGDVAGARDWVAHHRDVGGINYIAIEFCFGDMTPAETLRSAELFATEVMARVQRIATLSAGGGPLWLGVIVTTCGD